MQFNTLARLLCSPRLLLSSWQTGQLASAQCSGLHITTSLNFAEAVPLKPKRPMNAYIRYVQGVRSSLASANPKATPMEIAKLAAVKWQSLDQTSKTKYEEEYKREQAVWLQKNAKYLSQLTDAQKEEIKLERQQRNEGKIKREQKRLLKELGRPKRPINGYLRFCQQNKPVLGLSKQDNKMQMKNLGLQWRQLTDAEKEPYNKEAEADMKRYQEEMKKWEDKMLSTENVEAVRKKNVLLPPSPASSMAKKGGIPMPRINPAPAQKQKKSPTSTTTRP
ncbi:transcription factor A, mitochondrial [Anopheles marshallii]|uniref:transcription factor A, mitochondrial n=1 Tax=Anopheles marshallii TaxID=1521116 RepID=UPI00237C3C61|nr:transcription factor A, mitochondrial [Anopheles marshallii]